MKCFDFIPPLFGLAPCGVCHAPRITERAVRSYRTFSPLPRPKPWRYILCGTFRLTDLNPQSRTLSGTLLFEVRTFLSPLRAAQNIWRSQRDSDHPIQHQLNTIIRRRGMNFSYHPAKQHDYPNTPKGPKGTRVKKSYFGCFNTVFFNTVFFSTSPLGPTAHVALIPATTAFTFSPDSFFHSPALLQIPLIPAATISSW